MTDQELIHGLRLGEGSRQRFENELYLTYRYFIQEGCQKYRLNQEDGFSAYSDAVLSVITSITGNRFEGRSSLKTYLFQIFSNKCVDLVRRNTSNKSSVHHSSALPEMMQQMPDGAKNAVERMMQKFQWSLVAGKLQELGDKCRQMLRLFEEGYSDQQIADAMAYQTAAVAKTSRLRCIDKLREKINETLTA